MTNKYISENSPDIRISCISNVYTRMMHFKEKNTIELGHKHFYDHSMLLAKGRASVRIYDQQNDKFEPDVEFTAPATIFIKKGLVHQIESLEDDTVVYCIHALRDENKDIIDPSMLPVPTSLVDTIDKYYKETKKDLLPPAVSIDDLTGNRHTKVNDVFSSF